MAFRSAKFALHAVLGLGFVIAIPMSAYSVSYNVRATLKESGQNVSNLGVIVLENQKAVVQSGAADGKDATTFEGTVTPLKDGMVSIDYRLTVKKKDRAVEIAKSAVVVKEGVVEKTTLRDSVGNDMLLEVSVKKQ